MVRRARYREPPAPFRPSAIPGRDNGAWPQVPSRRSSDDGLDSGVSGVDDLGVDGEVGPDLGLPARSAGSGLPQRRAPAPQRPLFPDSRAGSSPKAPAREGRFGRGQRVKHVEYGAGTVIASSAFGSEELVLVRFDRPPGQAEEPVALDSPPRPCMIDMGTHADAQTGMPHLGEVLPALKAGAVRFLCAGALPVVAFYVAFRIGGPVIGIITGMAVSLAVLAIQAYRLRRLDPVAVVPMTVILAQGLLATWFGSVELYLAAPAVEAVIWGVVLVGSVALRRPLVPLIARELGVVPSRFAASVGLQRSLGVLTLAWGIAAFCKAGLRLWLLTLLPLEAFLIAVTLGLTGMNVVMLAISVWLPLAMVRREPGRCPA